MDSKVFAKRLIDELNDAQTEVLVDFLTSFFDRCTIAHIESELIRNNPDVRKYNNFDEFLDEIDREENGDTQ